MNLKRLHTVNFENNDIYRLEVYLDKIIVNEDYHGLRILDSSLNTIKIISIIDGLIVDFIYKKSDGNSVLIYDLNNGLLVLVELETFNHRIIHINDTLQGYFYSRNYYWQGNTLIFAMENDDNFYQFNFISLALEKISQKHVQTIAPHFFDFCKACRKHKAITVYPDKEAFIFQKNRNLIAFYDYKNKNLILTKHKLGQFEEIYHYKDSFIFFYSWEKSIVFQKNKAFLSSAEPNYYCLRIDFLSNDTMVILETNKDNHKFCILSVYELKAIESATDARFTEERKLRLRLLLDLKMNISKGRELLEKIAEVYADFNYPSEMEEFIYYMPEKNYDPSRYSHHENEQRLLRLFDEFLEKEKTELQKIKSGNK